MVSRKRTTRLPVGVGGRARLDGLVAISQYLELSVLKVRQLYAVTVPEADRLPVFVLCPHKGKNSIVRAFIDELDGWMDRMADRHYRRDED